MVRFLILITAWLMISGFLEVVILNSPDEVFFSYKRFSPFFNKSLCWFIFHCILVIWWFVGTSTLAPCGPHWSYLVDYVYFGSIWSNSVFIVSIQSILSTLICFSPIRAIRSNLVLFSPLCPLQSYSIIYIYIYIWLRPEGNPTTTYKHCIY